MTSNSRVPDDPYTALGVPAGAGDDEITRAYRRLAREHHPDANPDAQSDSFAGITDAYDLLRDPERRRVYDDTRHTRAQAARAAAGVRIPVHHVDPRPAEAVSPASANRGPAVDEIELPLSFDHAALGTIATIPVRTNIACSHCDGTGRGPATSCPSCAGRGSLVRTSGGVTIRTQCRTCAGAGQLPPPPCATCHGKGAHAATRDLTVRVPAGVETGTRLRVRLANTPATDIVAVVRVDPHPYFERRGDDLTLRLPITVAEAALGAVVTVPTLDSAVAIRIPPGTPHGRILRVRGRGVPRPGHAGDLLVDIAIDIPAQLNDAQRAALQAFAAATASPRTGFNLHPGANPSLKAQ